MKAGGAFVIAEAGAPEARVAAIAQDCQAQLTVTDRLFAAILAQIPYQQGFCAGDEHDAAFATYTSGTTGALRGIVHERGNIQLSARSLEREGKLLENSSTRFAVISPLDFSASNLIFNVWAYSGSPLFIPDYSTVKNPQKLIAYLADNRIDETFLTPSLLRALSPSLPSCLQTVYTGSAPADGIDGRSRAVYNFYMMSEACFVVAKHRILEPQTPCPLGVPVEGIEVRLSNEGEIEVRVPYTRGYLGVDEADENPFEQGWLKTGDLGAHDADGRLVFAGRLSDMVKIDGNRVEPAEVEAAFERATDGAFPCVVKFESESDAFLALYYVEGEEGPSLEVETVRVALEAFLPYYMMPSHFVRIDEIPLTAIGKVDRKALPRPHVRQAAYIAAKTETERRFCEAAERVLRVDRVGMADDFFELGGRSLDVMAMVAELDFENLEAHHFYHGRTLRAIVDAYEFDRENCALSEWDKELEGRKGLRPFPYASQLPFAVQQWLGDNTDEVTNISRGLRLRKTVDIGRLRDALNAYMDAASMFKTVYVLDEQGAPCFKYAPELFKPLAIEAMTERELEALCENFIGAYNQPGKLLYTIRLVQTEKHAYLLYDMSHYITDGEGQMLLFQDIVDAYVGKPIAQNLFFAWLYDEVRNKERARYRQALAHRAERMAGYEWVPLHVPTDEPRIVADEMDTGVKLKDLERYCKRGNMSRSILFSAAMILVQARFTKTKDLLFCSLYSGRVGLTNHGGVRFLVLVLIMHMERYATLEEYLTGVRHEYERAITEATDIRHGVEDLDTLAFSLDDLGDMRQGTKVSKALFEPIELGRAYKGKDCGRSFQQVVNFFNAGDKLMIRLCCDNSLYSEAFRKEYCEALFDALRRIMAGDESVLTEYRGF